MSALRRHILRIMTGTLVCVSASLIISCGKKIQPDGPAQRTSDTRAVAPGASVESGTGIAASSLSSKEVPLSLLTTENMASFYSYMSGKKPADDFSHKMANALGDLEIKLRSKTATRDEKLQLIKVCREGVFAFLGTNSMGQILDQEDIRGWTKAKVEESFGAPSEVHGNSYKYIFDDGLSYGAWIFDFENDKVVKIRW